MTGVSSTSPATKRARRRSSSTGSFKPSVPAYGFSAKKDLLAQLLALNQEVAAKIEKGEPVTAPGVPPNYPDAKRLVTEDCIRSPVAGLEGSAKNSADGHNR